MPRVALGRLLQTLALTLSPPGRSPARPSASFSSETWQGESTCPSSHQCRGLPRPSILPEAGMALRASLDSQAAQTPGAARASGGHTHAHIHPHGHTPTRTHTHGHTHMNTYTNTHTHTHTSPPTAELHFPRALSLNAGQNDPGQSLRVTCSHVCAPLCLPGSPAAPRALEEIAPLLLQHQMKRFS